jgi:GAF domain-containing protein
MSEQKAADVLSRISTAIGPDHDLADLLAQVAASCREVLGVDATGIMVLSRGGRLQLLSASSHDAVELELHQSQIDEGPCVDAARDDASIAVVGQDGLRETWPRFGPAMISSGFLAVHSAPLRWKSSTLGAMALFRRGAEPFGPEEDETAQAFADLAARAIVSDDSDVDAATERALQSRIAVERAKGVIMESDDVSAGEAYDRLLQRATRTGTTLTVAATQVLDGAAR